MDIQGFIDSSGFLTTSDYEEDPYRRWCSFDLIESDIRNMHPESLTPKTVEDPRFANPSLVNTHAWAFSYLHLWCMRPQSMDGSISIKQRFVAIFCKPVAALSDAVINTAFLPLKLVFLVDRVAMTCFTFILQTSIYGPSLSHSCQCLIIQMIASVRSIAYLVCQPISFVSNIISPKFDLLYLTRNLPGWSYTVHNPDNAKETVLDQGRVRFLRQYLGWQNMGDTLLQSVAAKRLSEADIITYTIKGDKLLINATWAETLYLGGISYTYRCSHKNYKE